jgi:hypothetical protein
MTSLEDYRLGRCGYVYVCQVNLKTPTSGSMLRVIVIVSALALSQSVMDNYTTEFMES